jgi:hypothetical protein
MHVTRLSFCLVHLQVVDMFNPEFFVGAYRAPGGPWKPAALYTGSNCGQIPSLLLAGLLLCICLATTAHGAAYS